MAAMGAIAFFFKDFSETAMTKYKQAQPALMS